MKETTRLIISDINWCVEENDIDFCGIPTEDEVIEAIENVINNLPQTVIIDDFPIEVLCGGDDDEICEEIYDYLDENYGFCVKGFNWEEIE